MEIALAGSYEYCNGVEDEVYLGGFFLVFVCGA